MRIVINIPDKMYNTFNRGIWSSTYDGKIIRDIVLKGTPLPKGHGRLVDVEDVKDNIRKWRGYLDEDMIGRINFAMDNHIPTIIESNKEDN